MTTKPLNHVEEWVADHGVPILLVLGVLILAGAGALLYTYSKQSATADQVRVIAPQVTRVNKAICDAQSLNHPQRAQRCAERIRVGLINCRHSQSCRAAWLALVTYPPPARGATEVSSGSAGDTEGGDAHQQPSNHGHQQPGPGKGHGQPAEPAPSPPAPSPAPEKPGNGPPVETPGNGPPVSPGRGSASGSNVEVCVDPLNACAAVELGDGAKGLLP